ncbi:MAG: hypothetical protein GX804_00965 [Lentisphaerae bacterium]|nr:hypothetical protein [Lentisphaerota bacterium]
MNKTFGLCICLLVIAVEATADFTMPKKVYRLDRLEQAKADAESRGRPISIIYTQEKTSCGLTAGASLNAADKLSKRTVVVYAECNAEWEKLPPDVKQALRAPELGRYVPKTVIMDAALTNVIAYVPYARGAEQEKLIKEAIRKIPKATPKSGLARLPPPRPSAPLFSIPPADDREVRTWQSRAGATVEAALVHERSGRVVLKMQDGNMTDILVVNLTKENRDYLQKIRDESSDEEQETEQ